MNVGRAFVTTVLPGGIALVKLAVPGSELNLLTPAHANDLAVALEGVKRERGLCALVLASGRPGCFSAGADLEELIRLHAAQDGVDLARRTQRAIEQLSALGLPLVAAIHGPCLGVALALALAADTRIASSHPSTCFAFPEVRLGLVPVGCTTQRLPEVGGLEATLDLLLTARTVLAAEALDLGLVDQLVTPETIEGRAAECALALARRRSEGSRFPAMLLRPFAAVRTRFANRRGRHGALLRDAWRAVRAGRHGRHQAPERLLRVLETGLEQGPSAGLVAERREFGELLVTPEAKHLMRFCLETNALRHDVGVHDGSVRPAPIESLGIVGGGTMAPALAAEIARAGMAVRLRGSNTETLARDLRAIRADLERAVSCGMLEERARERVLGRITVTTGYAGFGGATAVFDTSPGDLAAKQRVAAEIRDHTHPQVILVTTTTTIPVGQVASSAKNLERSVGWVQQGPVQRGRLVEIATPPRTAPWAVATVVSLARTLERTPIVVRDTPCFYVPRLAGAWYNEALRLVLNGVPPGEVDAALVDWGFAEGPLALVGLDYAASLELLRTAAQALGERMALPRTVAEWLVRGKLGGRNWLSARFAPLPARRDIVERCVMRVVNEAALCFGEGVIRSARDANLGAVLGMGFPSYRGGPLRYIDEMGVVETVRRLDRLGRTHDSRFTPADLLVAMARSGGTFHGPARVLPGSARGEH